MAVQIHRSFSKSQNYLDVAWFNHPGMMELNVVAEAILIHMMVMRIVSAIHTTVVPISILTRMTVMPIRILICRTGM